MEIIFGTNKIKKVCNKSSGKLKRRLDDIRASDNMEVLKSLPGRLHPLLEDRKGQWALDLDHPNRLCFLPIENPMPISKDGRLNLSKIKAVQIVFIGDYHGK